MTGRLIWCGPLRGALNSLIAPPALGPYANSRFYTMPAPGQVVVWPIREAPSEPRPLPADPPWSLLVIEDLFEKLLSDKSLINEPVIFEESLVYGHDRARDLARRWTPGVGNRPGGWGVVLIAGKMPTDQEIEEARDLRRVWLEMCVARAEQSYRLGQSGRPGKASYDLADLAYAQELGRRLPDSLETLAAVPDMKACPECAEMIQVAARRCRFCGSGIGELTLAGGGKRR